MKKTANVSEDDRIIPTHWIVLYIRTLNDIYIQLSFVSMRRLTSKNNLFINCFNDFKGWTSYREDVVAVYGFESLSGIIQ